MLFFLILGIIVGGVLVIFILQNIAIVTVSFFTWHMTGSLAMILLAAMVGGVVMTLLFILPSLIRDEFYLRATKKQKKEVEDELFKYKAALTEANARQVRTDAGRENITPQSVV